MKPVFLISAVTSGLLLGTVVANADTPRAVATPHPTRVEPTPTPTPTPTATPEGP